MDYVTIFEGILFCTDHWSFLKVHFLRVVTRVLVPIPKVTDTVYDIVRLRGSEYVKTLTDVFHVDFIIVTLL